VTFGHHWLDGTWHFCRVGPKSHVALIWLGKEATGSRGQGEGPGPLPRWCLMLAGEPGVWPVDRLTDDDQRMLWPDEIWPQEIGALASWTAAWPARAAACGSGRSGR
jgi:hypothetical protein